MAFLSSIMVHNVVLWTASHFNFCACVCMSVEGRDSNIFCNRSPPCYCETLCLTELATHLLGQVGWSAKPDIAGSPTLKQQRALFPLQQDKRKVLMMGERLSFTENRNLPVLNGSRLNIILNSVLSSSCPVPEFIPRRWFERSHNRRKCVSKDQELLKGKGECNPALVESLNNRKRFRVYITSFAVQMNKWMLRGEKCYPSVLKYTCCCLCPSGKRTPGYWWNVGAVILIPVSGNSMQNALNIFLRNYSWNTTLNNNKKPFFLLPILI